MKKIINLSIVCALFIHSTAINADVLDNAMMNLTRPQTYSPTDASGNAISHNFYSGGIAYRFNTSTPPPLFSASPPQLETGCNGLNLKGMFVSLLNLDQLGAMLQNAGASLAWGVAIGLIYSLPGVASAFKMINEWATKLQQILGNACQTGMNIGMAIAEKAGIDKNSFDATLASFIPNPADSLQNGESFKLDAFGVTSTLNSGVFSFSASKEKLTSEKQKDAVVNLFAKAFMEDVSIGGSLFQNFMKNNPDIKKTKIESTLTADSPAIKIQTYYVTASTTSGLDNPADGTIKTISIGDLSRLGNSEITGNLSYRQNIERAWFTYMLIYNFVGDIGFTTPSIKNVINSIESLNDQMNGRGDTASEANTAYAITKPEELGSFTKQIVGAGSAVPAEVSGIVLAELLYYGLTMTNRTSLDYAYYTEKIVSELKAPPISVAAIKEPNSGEYAIISFVKPEEKDLDLKFFTSTADSTFKGTEEGSICAIKQIIEHSTNTNSSTNSCGIVPLIEGIEYYAEIIRNSPQKEKQELLYLLAGYNAKEAGIAILDQMLLSLKEITHRSKEKNISTDDNGKQKASKNNGTLSNNDSAILIREHTNAYESLVASAKEELSKLGTSNLSKKDLDVIFENQKMKNRARGLSSQSK